MLHCTKVKHLCLELNLPFLQGGSQKWVPHSTLGRTFGDDKCPLSAFAAPRGDAAKSLPVPLTGPGSELTHQEDLDTECGRSKKTTNIKEKQVHWWPDCSRHVPFLFYCAQRSFLKAKKMYTVRQEIHAHYLKNIELQISAQHLPIQRMSKN